MNVSISIDEGIVQRLDGIAKSMNRSRSYAVSEAIERYVSYQEWYIASVEAAVAQADSGGPFVSHGEVVAKLEALWKEPA